MTIINSCLVKKNRRNQSKICKQVRDKYKDYSITFTTNIKTKDVIRIDIACFVTGDETSVFLNKGIVYRIHYWHGFQKNKSGDLIVWEYAVISGTLMTAHHSMRCSWFLEQTTINYTSHFVDYRLSGNPTMALYGRDSETAWLHYFCYLVLNQKICLQAVSD